MTQVRNLTTKNTYVSLQKRRHPIVVINRDDVSPRKPEHDTSDSALSADVKYTVCKVYILQYMYCSIVLPNIPHPQTMVFISTELWCRFHYRVRDFLGQTSALQYIKDDSRVNSLLYYNDT